ncbi:hypothetical protein LIER_19373 [Lithospermum erythrorhizon]|uniref:Uncharacterized protein n=1 Tax=Lithospermum erythrorhizon TaxID=34254 RepID=A0AAV3QJT9_LITER
MAREKRGTAEIDERLELDSKNSKMQDLNSGFQLAERMGEEAAEPVVDAVLTGLDLNAKVTPFRRQEIKCEVAMKLKVFSLDLNAEDVSSSFNKDHFHPCKNLDCLKSKDDSECASSMGPLEERDPLKVWNEMKKNGFLSLSRSCVSMPKKRGRKAKTDGISKKKIEIAKREQVDKFAKIASPSGLLNGLNLGIINHVRNSKQVHSIIDALMKSEQNESCHTVSKPGSQTKCVTKEFGDQKYETFMNNPGEYKYNQVSQFLEPHSSSQMKGYPGSANRSVSMISNLARGDGPSYMMEKRNVGVTTDSSHFNSLFKDGVLGLKLSSSTRLQSLSNEDSENKTSVNSLSVNAASVASQWLELVHQDVKGRLAALHRSKKRVCEVIHTELPCMLSREFPSYQDNDLSTSMSSFSHSNNATAEMHRTKWDSLFHQMDKSLSEEEERLENWLCQVKQMQLHCDMGLFNYNAPKGLKHKDSADMNCRSKKADKLDRDLSIRAAAASIYSTCNLLSMENLPHC